MAETVDLTLPVAPALLAERLDAFGREWRESKLPASLRAAGFYTCTVDRTGDVLLLKLGPQGRGPQIAGEVQIRPTAASGASQVHVTLRQTTASRAGAVVGIACAAAWAGSAIYLGSGLFGLSGVALMVGFLALMTRSRARDQAERLRSLLEHLGTSTEHAA
jgi:hypothetical protein